MKRKEIEVISKDLWKEESRYRKDSKNAHDVKMQQELFAEINALGYDFYWDMQFHSQTFTEKDKAVIPIIIKYLHKFENEKLCIPFLCSLGTKGFYDATEYLINEYKKYIPPNYDEGKLNVVSQTIAHIIDVRFVDEYLDFLKEGAVGLATGYIVRMLGMMKIEKAIPCLIKLLERENTIPNSYIGTVLEEGKYGVSQSAIEALSRFKNPEHIKYIEKFLEPEKLSWIVFVESPEKRNNLKSTYREYKKVAEKAIKRMQS